MIAIQIDIFVFLMLLDINVKKNPSKQVATFRSQYTPNWDDFSLASHLVII